MAHNNSWNNRAADVDFWTQALVEKAISPFSKLFIWEEDHYHMAQIIVKLRVFSLEAIPWFFVLTEGEDFESQSWTIQCEIPQTHMLGEMPQDEDLPPIILLILTLGPLISFALGNEDRRLA